jgi:hypothetical protein
MASIDEELRMDDEENSREIVYIREQLPAELKDKFTDDDLVFIMDSIGEYFFSSGILETNEEEVDIDLDVISDFVCQEAKNEGRKAFDPQEVFFVVQADLDFQEQ